MRFSGKKKTRLVSRGGFFCLKSFKEYPRLRGATLMVTPPGRLALRWPAFFARRQRDP